MAGKAPKRPTAKQMTAASKITAAIQTMTDFDGGADCKPEDLHGLEQDVTTKRATETQTKNTADAARDAAAASENTFYQRSLRVREKVIGQFGSNSDEAAAVGLKKKSERKKPTRKKPAGSA